MRETHARMARCVRLGRSEIGKERKQDLESVASVFTRILLFYNSELLPSLPKWRSGCTTEVVNWVVLSKARLLASLSPTAPALMKPAVLYSYQDANFEILI